MSWRSIFGTAGLVLALAACYWVSASNRELLARELQLGALSDAPLTLTVGQAIVASFGLGAALVTLAWTLQGSRQVSSRASERRRWLDDRDLDARYREGLEAALAGRPEVALQGFQDVVERRPDHRRALLAGADALRALDRTAEAVEWRERALAVEPEDAAALEALAGDHRARGDVELAAAALERAVAAAEGTPEQRRLALRTREAQLEAGAHDRALSAHDRWARLARRSGDRPDSDQPADLERAAIETRWAGQEAVEGRTKEARSRLRRVLRRHPEHVPACLALAQAQLLEGDEAAALDTWVEGYERTREGAILVAAEQHFTGPIDEEHAIERTSTALSAFRRFAACSGERPQAVAFLGKLFTRLEMLDDAARAFGSVSASFPDNPTFTYYASRIAEKRGEAGQAARGYRGIIKSLDVLRLRYRCHACDVETAAYADRCPACARWGTVSLDIGLRQLHEPLPAVRPMYAVEAAGDDRGHTDRPAEDDVLA